MKNFFLSDPKLLFYGFSIMFFASFGQTFFISIFNYEIRNFYDLSNGKFGLIYAIATLFSSMLLVGFAKLIDYIDLRIYSLIISLGLFLSCFGIYFMQNSIFYIFAIIFGLRFFGQGAMSHAGVTTMARYFDDNRGKAISVGSLGGMIGFMILPIIVVKLNFIFDWQFVWLLSSFAILFLFIPSIFFNLSNQKTRHLNFVNSIDQKIDEKIWKTREVLFDTKFYIYLPISIAFPFVGTGLMFHQIFIINEKDWTLQMLGESYVLLGLFSVVGLFFGGPIIDFYNTKKTVLFSLLPLFLALLTLIFFSSYISLYIYMSLYGLGIGISSPFIGSLWAELYGLKSLGSVKALLHAYMVLGSALSPVFFGFIIDFGYGLITIGFISISIILISTLLPIIYKSNL